MKLEFETQFRLITGMFDEHYGIKPYAILDIFQRVAGDHADKLGIGTLYCEEHNYAWILARQEVYLYDNPNPTETVIVRTFPHAPSKIEFKREYEMRSLDGVVYARGCASWVLLDLTTRRMLRSDNIYPDGEFITSEYFQDKLSKPTVIQDEIYKIDTYKVVKSDIDIYHHMNNAKYAEVLFDYCDYKAIDISHFAINYQHEIKQNEAMDIYKQVEDDTTYITGISNNQIIFTSFAKKKII